MSTQPPLRLRLSLALLIMALAAVTVGAAVSLGTGQDAPTTVSAAAVAPTGPPVDALEHNPTAAEAASPSMRLGVPDKASAIRAERQARAEARARQEIAAAQAAAIAEYAAAVEAAPPVDVAPTAPAPAPRSDPPAADDGGGDGGGGGGGSGGGGSLYERLDDIARCESGMNPRAFNPAGPWYGAFQFRRDTWLRSGGGPGDIRDYSYEEQREVAANLVRSAGFAGSWPSCAAQFGYT